MIRRHETTYGECDKCGRRISNNTSSSEVGIWSIETTHIHCEYETDKQLVEKRVVAAYCDDCSPLMRDLLSEIFSPWVDTNCDGESVDVYLG